MNVTGKTINTRMSAAQAHLTHAHKNNTTQEFLKIVKTDKPEHHKISYFGGGWGGEYVHELISTKIHSLKKKKNVIIKFLLTCFPI